MYTQFRELTALEPISAVLVRQMRTNIGKRAPLAVGHNTQDPSKIALVIVDAPEIPWTMAQSPWIIFMQNEISGSKRMQGAFQRAFKDFPVGDYQLSDLGVDHTNLLNKEYDWGTDYRKVKDFVDKAEAGGFLIDIKDHEGIECFGCSFLGRYGCNMDGGGCHHQIDGCLHEAMAIKDEIDEDYEEEEYYDPEYEEDYPY